MNNPLSSESTVPTRETQLIEAVYDLTGIVMRLTKASYLVARQSDLEQTGERIAGLVPALDSLAKDLSRIFRTADNHPFNGRIAPHQYRNTSDEHD